MIKNNYYDIENKYHKKIAVLSDIHFNIKYNYQLFLDIINNLKKNKPDYICIPGDIIDDNNVLENNTLKNRLFKFIESMSLISKVIISLGNHEKLYNRKYKKNHNIDFFESLNSIKNVYVLNNENKIFENINFIGFDPDIKYFLNKENINTLIEEFKKIEKNIIDNKYNILLCHSPIKIINDEIYKTTKLKNIDLILSGHMHNGLVLSIFNKIKGNRGFVGPYRNFFPKLARGKVKKENTTLIITGGIIKLSYSSHLNKFNKIFTSDIDYINI